MVEGVQKFQHQLLKKMPAAIEAQMRISLEKSADEIVSMMRRLAPARTGRLRNSIGWTWGAPPKGSMAIGSLRSKGSFMITIYAGSDGAYYARMIEFGTIKMGARPFFYPAYRAQRKRVVSRTRRDLRKAIKGSLA